MLDTAATANPSLSMNEDVSQSQDRANARKTSGRERSQSPKRAINNVALAAMLRESASFVEKGEFDPILYQALTDFRLYYKEHLPKRRGKMDDKSRRKNHSSKKKVLSTTTTYIPAAADADAVQVMETTGTGTGTGTGANAPEGNGNSTLNSTFDGTGGTGTGTATIATESPAPAIIETPRPASPEGMLMSTKQTSTSVRSVIEEPGPDPSAAAVAAVVAVSLDPPASASAPEPTALLSPSTIQKPTAMLSPSTIQKHNVATAMFGNFKFPKMNLTSPNPHFTATSKKNAQRAKDELVEMRLDNQAQQTEAKQATSSESGWFPMLIPAPSFAASSKKNADRAKAELEEIIGEQAPLAECSSRRKAPEEPERHIREAGAGWCEVHFTMGCACKEMPRSATYAGPDATHPPGDETSTHDDDSSLLSTQDQKALSTTSLLSSRSENANNATTTTPVIGNASVAFQSLNANQTIHTDTSTAAASVKETTTLPNSDKMQTQEAKPAFQRPVSKNSSLIANGWIEQQRRSKMRSVWKDVLASLVLGRKPGEETTLWIQREIVNSVTGKTELEALHQIPLKLLQEVTYLSYSADNRFTLKLYNQYDEYIFRCNSDIAAMNWVMTLKKCEQHAKAKTGVNVNVKPTVAPVAEEPFPKEKPFLEEEKKGTDQSPPHPHTSTSTNTNTNTNSAAQPEPTRLTVRDLRATCHGAGINTMGMERGELEAAAEQVRKRGTYFQHPPGGQSMPTAANPILTAPPAPQTAPPPAQPAPSPAPAAQPTAPPPPPQAAAAAPTEGNRPEKTSISELRAVCHGDGINTSGMERSELEAAAEKVRKRGTYFDTPTPTKPPPAPSSSNDMFAAGHDELEKQDDLRARKEDLRRQEELRARQDDLRRQDELRARQDELRRQEDLRRRQELEDQKRREAEEAIKRKIGEERGRAAEEEARRRQAEEEHRRRAEEEHRRRIAEQQAAEQRRRQQEEEMRRQQQVRYAEQQAAWQKQQQDDEKRRLLAEQQATEQRRRHEEAIRKQQQWAGQQQQQKQWAAQQQPPAPHAQQQQQQQWGQQQQTPWGPHQGAPRQPQQQQQNTWHQQQGYQQQQQQTSHQTPPPQQRHHKPPPHAQHAHQQQWNQQPQQQQTDHHDPHSAVNEKYAKMANQTEDDGQAAITRIKHDILIQWALQPPQLQMLRPIDMLVTTIHNVFPPNLGVPVHAYFGKWKPLNRNDMLGDSGTPEEEKLTKAVRKIRFFLHPDKLPKDLNAEQQFMVKMLWDITSDAWEEFEKSKEELDWIK